MGDVQDKIKDLNLIGSGWSLPDLQGKKREGDEPAKLRVVSYNVLAQSKLKGPHYAYCSGAQVNWKKRRQVLLHEVLRFKADVLCLQEIDNYEDWWRPHLSEAGYDSIFQKRGRRFRDGVATFFLRSKFQLFASELLDFNKVGTFLGEKNPSFRLQQDNCAVILGLQPWETSDHPSALCVVNAQLVAPKTDDLQVVQKKQLLMLVRSLERFNSDFQLPVVMCGSFNLLPMSSNYYMIKNGIFPPKLQPPAAVPSRPCAEPISHAQIRITWESPPWCGDAPLQGFVVCRRVGGNNSVGFQEPRYFDGGDIRSAVIGGLASGLTYEFIVAGVSAVGIGEFSQPCLPTRTNVNPASPPVGRFLKNPTQAGEYVVDTALETISDWVTKGPGHEVCCPAAVEKELGMLPTFEDKSLNLLPNPSLALNKGARHKDLIHTLNFESAYSRYGTAGTEPVATVNSERFRGCVDYIFFEKARLIPTKILQLEMPVHLDGSGVKVSKDGRKSAMVPDEHDTMPARWDDEEFLDVDTGTLPACTKIPNPSFVSSWEPLSLENKAALHNWFPNDDVPSDHLPLLVDFSFQTSNLAARWS